MTMGDVLASGFMENHRLMDEIVEAVGSAWISGWAVAGWIHVASAGRRSESEIRAG